MYKVLITGVNRYMTVVFLLIKNAQMATTGYIWSIVNHY